LKIYDAETIFTANLLLVFNPDKLDIFQHIDEHESMLHRVMG